MSAFRPLYVDVDVDAKLRAEYESALVKLHTSPFTLSNDDIRSIVRICGMRLTAELIRREIRVRLFGPAA